MAVVHGKAFQVNINSNTMEEYLSDISLSIDVDVAEVTTSGDAAKTFTEGDYSGSWSGSGPADFTDTSGADELTFGLIGGGATTWEMLPGSGSASATNPSYSQSAILTNYTLSASVGDAVRASYAAQGTGAITRSES